LLCLPLLLLGVPVQALDFHFSSDAGALPAGCRISSPGNYVCSSLTLAAGDTLSIAPSNSPTTIQVEGTLTVAAGSVINGAGKAVDLNIVVGAALALGASVVTNASLVGSAAVTIGADSKIGGSISTTTTTGAVTLGANSTVAGSVTTVDGPIVLGAGSAVAGSISTDSGALTLGADSAVAGSISTVSGPVTLGASSKVAGNISTVNGAITLGAKVNADGSISTDSGAITVGAGSFVTGSISSVSGAIGIGAGSQITGAISSVTGAVAVGADTSVNGGVSSQSGAVSVGAGVLVCGSSDIVFASCSQSAAAFDCLEHNANQPWDSTARRPLYTRLAGQPFSFDVVALQASGGLLSAYVAGTSTAKTISLELVDGAGSTACESRAAIGSAQSLVFSAANQGRGVSPAFVVPSAVASLRCRIRDSSAIPALVACSSESFSVRPSGFSLSAPDANASPSGTNASAVPVIKAGALFSLTATSSAAGYSGTPVLNPNSLQAHAGALQSGLLSGSFAAATVSNGVSVSSGSFRYGEVGYFSLDTGAVVDRLFTAPDQAAGRCVADSFSNQVDASGRIGCNIGSAASAFFGRFTPDHFAVTAGRFANRCSGAACTDVAGPSESRFTYIGEDFAIRGFTLSASNGFSPPSLTRNYTGAFARLDPLAAGSFSFAAVNLADRAALTSATGFTNGGAPGQLQLLASDGQWTAGVGRMNAAFRLNRSDLPLGPFEAWSLGIDPSDADQVGVLASDKNLASQIASTALSDRVLIGSSVLRYGRVRLQSACSPALQDVAVPLRAEYWNGQLWRLNSDDIGTRLTLSFAPISSPDISRKTCVIESANSSGQGCLQPSLTGSQNFLEGGLSGTDSQGRAGFEGNFNLWLKAPGAGNSGVISVTASVPTWLQFAWQTADSGNPVARVTFGSCSPVIYQRENF
jgi:hypothetical protein